MVCRIEDCFSRMELCILPDERAVPPPPNENDSYDHERDVMRRTYPWTQASLPDLHIDSPYIALIFEDASASFTLRFVIVSTSVSPVFHVIVQTKS